MPFNYRMAKQVILSPVSPTLDATQAMLVAIFYLND